MHRTTINLDKALYTRLLALAEKYNTSITKTISELLANALLPKAKSKKKQRIVVHRGVGPIKGVDVTDRNLLYDLMEGR
jgi:hypothetical protein